MNGGEQQKPSQPGLFTRIVRRRYGNAGDDYTQLAEALDDNPAAGWLYGAILAGLVASYGAIVIVQEAGVVPNLTRRGPWVVEVVGPAAFWWGCTLIGGGLLLHFHSFWGTHRGLSRYHEIAWFAALPVTLVAAAMFAYHMLR